MSRLTEYSCGLSIDLRKLLDEQVPDETPRCILHTLGNIIGEVGLDISVNDLEINRRFDVDKRTVESMEKNLDLPPRFFVTFGTSLSTSPTVPEAIAIAQVRDEVRRRQDFMAHVNREQESGALRIEVKPPAKLEVIKDHLEILGTSDTPVLQIACYHQYYCLPEELAGLHNEANRAIARIYTQHRTIDFTKPPAECYSRVLPPIGRSFEEKFQGAAGALNRAIAEIPPVPNDSGDAHPDGDSLIPPSAR